MTAKICIASLGFMLAIFAMPSLALDSTQQTLIDDFARAFVANKECDYTLNADRIAADLAKAGLSFADFGPGGRYNPNVMRSVTTFRDGTRLTSKAVQCGGLALRLGPPITIKGNIVGVDWLARSPQDDHRKLKDVERFLDYIAR